ncbi:hypothetical protein [Rubellicoccus peritrichatus]|uniref:Type II/III secretion system secretin-like domain-containing protein n=1 Tax=Rubellicoccus peritrichatus TaxID=3080537 RepID=A0AAQ3QVQ8_9BACT|nr:hypothetical protein [Puniceicoccus sp. CR14]WOO41883.1 hypothetical protein RZN69_02200 [Puniceicoccus sp. CR14]
MKIPGNSQRIVSYLVLAILLAGSMLSMPSAAAQSTETKDKIRLMSAALRARDAGDLNVAKENLEDLLRINPDDPNVQNLLDAVNKDIERKSSGEPTVYGQAASVSEFSPSSAGASSSTPIDTSSLDGLLEAEATAQKAQVEQAEEALASAKKLIKVGRTEEAEDLLAQAQASLPLNTATVFVIEDIQEMRGKILVDQGEAELAKNNVAQANAIADEYEEKLGEDDQLKAYLADIEKVSQNPWRQNPEDISPEYVANQQVVEQLLVKGRAQMLYGDIEGAVQTFREVEARDPTNAAAKALQVKATQILNETSYLDHTKTRDEMMQEIARSWQRPQIFDRESEIGPEAVPTVLLDKISSIEIPSVKFSGVPLSRVVETLSELSVEYDDPTLPLNERGVNMVLIAPPGQDPPVSITLRNLKLDKILDFTVETVSFQWDIRNEAVLVTKGTTNLLETEFFPISRGVVIRLTGAEDSGGGGSAPADPFAPAAAPSAGPSASDTEDGLKSFFQRAGVDFEGVPGSSLAFDGTQLIVTQSPRNLEKMRNILRRYDQPKQVEIEAKFMEVNQGSLDELGFSWNIRSGSVTTGINPTTGAPITSPKSQFQTDNRSLSQAFSISRAGTLPLEIIQNGQTVINSDLAAPEIPNAIDLGTGATSLFSTFGIIDGVNVDLVINALQREEGSDLLSSPRLTVLSGRTAQIVVAQELRYPENFGDIESEVGTGNANGGGSAGVTITAGTPQDFTVRNVGVEMEVTPTVEENENISLKLEPRVTEFEGFVEYGGPSIAISGATTVTVPSGFFQPIFSTRAVRTEVTVYDGATVVIGGLTREEILTVNDKVPVLGDIPFIGRLFQNKGETSQKRNLLIFVTANLISPGGSPSKQRLKNVEPNSLFQNPIIVSPGGGVSRQIAE